MQPSLDLIFQEPMGSANAAFETRSLRVQGRVDSDQLMQEDTKLKGQERNLYHESTTALQNNK
jgi:hypothetical protein